MTPRTTVLVLLGVAAQVEAQCRLQITVGYLTAMLSQCDPAKAPKLDELLGDTEIEAASDFEHVPEQEDPRDNVRAWMAALGGAKIVPPETPPEDQPEDQPESDEVSDG